MFLIRDAVAGDMNVLGDVFRRSSLSGDGDRMNLLAHPDLLELSDLGVSQGRTRAAVSNGVIVGFATWLSAGDAIEIDDLFVDPDWMRLMYVDLSWPGHSPVAHAGSQSVLQTARARIRLCPELPSGTKRCQTGAIPAASSQRRYVAVSA